MATSLIFRISNYVVLEYIYSKTDIIKNTGVVKFNRVANGYNNEDTITNDDASYPITKNIIDNTVVALDDGRCAVLDKDSAYYYPSKDANIVVDQILFDIPINVGYDKVRLHVISGYNFEDIDGFIASIYVKMKNDKQLRLCNLSNQKADTGRLYFNPKPIKLAEFIYDKYYEFLVPSQSWMLDQQKLNPGSVNTLSYILTKGIGLADQNTVYCEYKNIGSTEYVEGFIYFYPGESIKFAFNSTDQFNLLTASIEQSDRGDFFEYYAQWDGSMIDEFIYRLNSVAGNNYYIIHELRILEQVGETFTETDNITSIQTDNYDKIRRIRPILRLAGSATSFSLEYTVRLYNSADGRSIFKSASLTSFDVNKYGEKSTKLNVGGTTEPLKVYNKVIGNKTFNITDNLQKMLNVKVITAFIDSQNIVVASDSDIDNTISGFVIKIDPFDNLYKFTLSQWEDAGHTSRIHVNLDTISNYYMVFVKPDGSKVYISEFISDNFNKSIGELGFRLTKDQAINVRNTVTNMIFYVIVKNSDGLETVIFSATWKK